MSPGPLLALAAVAIATSSLVARIGARLWLTSTLCASVAAFAASLWPLGGGPDWEWRSRFLFGGEALHLRLDAVSAFFLALLSLMGGIGSIYGLEYWSEKEHPYSGRTWRIWWSGLLLSLGSVLLFSNGLHFLIAWEVFTISSYFLITLDRQRLGVREAGWLYLACSHTATLSLFAFFASLAVKTHTWELGPMRDQAALAPLFWFALFGFGVKAGMFPLHVWLPSAHANAPSHVSAIMSGVTIKIGIYGILRFSGWLPVPLAAGWTVVVLGLASAVLGVAFALGQHDLKRLLAYHSVENVGIILTGLGFAIIASTYGNALWGQLALAGGLLHVWNHGLFKGLLFLGAGSVLHATHTREMSQLGGLWRRMPWTTGLFALGAVAICGLPPLNGFISEWLLYLGLFDAAKAHLLFPSLAALAAVILLALTGALALACFVKVCGVVFMGAPRSPAATRAHECGGLMRYPMAVLAALCVAIGLAPVVFWPAVTRAANTWNPQWTQPPAPGSLVTLEGSIIALAAVAFLGTALLWYYTRFKGVRPGLTWDCGYARPTARMQYTAGSFAAIIVEWFDWILTPVRHEERPVLLFPVWASFEERTPETVLLRVIQPVGILVLQVAGVARRLQHGGVHAYLAYLVIGLAALGLLVVVTGGY